MSTTMQQARIRLFQQIILNRILFPTLF